MEPLNILAILPDVHATPWKGWAIATEYSGGNPMLIMKGTEMTGQPMPVSPA